MNVRAIELSQKIEKDLALRLSDWRKRGAHLGGLAI